MEWAGKAQRTASISDRVQTHRGNYVRIGSVALAVSLAALPVSAAKGHPEISLSIDAAQPGSPISPLIFGGASYMTHLGSRWMTDGKLFWECFDGKKSPTIAEISDKLPDTLLAPLKELDLPIMKLCGYNRCSGSWRDWITAIDIGLEFCERIGAQPMFDFDWIPKERAGPSYPYLSREDRAAIVEYCNSTDISKGMGKLRAERGHPEPHNVQYWILGGECWHNGKVYYPDKEYAAQYGRDLVDWVPAMRAASPIPIRVGVDLCRWQSDWNRTVIEIAGNYIDFGGDHPVFPAAANEDGSDIVPAGCEKSLAYTASPLQLARWIDDIHMIIEDAKARGRMRREAYVRWGQTDYCVSINQFGDGSDPRDAQFQMVLTNAVQLQVLMQKNALLACHWQTLGKRPGALVETDGTRLGQYHLLDMLIHGFGQTLLDFEAKNMPGYDAPAFGQLFEPVKSVPYLGVSASRADNGDLCFYVINRDARRPMQLTINAQSFTSGVKIRGSVWTLTAPKMTSPPEEMVVTKRQVTLDNHASGAGQTIVVYGFPARSVTILRLFRTPGA